MSSRYATVVAMLDDDANLACVLRELRRRPVPKLALPPQRTASGTTCFMSFRWHLQDGGDPVQAERADVLAEVWSEEGANPTTARWWVTLSDGAELGPFDEEQDALSNATLMLRERNWSFVRTPPWDNDDRDCWPV